MIAIRNSLAHGGARLGAAFGAFDAWSKAFVIRVEIKQKVFRVDLVSRFVSLEHGFKEPRRVTDVPTRRAHEIRRLDHIVFNLEWRNNFHRARTNPLV